MPNITRKEASRLDDCERKIQEAIRKFSDAGEALKIIREDRLYRSEFASFNAYCKSRWGFTKQRANQLISATKQTSELPNLSNEAAAREYARHDEETRNLIRVELLDEEQVTTRDIQAVVKKQNSPEVVLDGKGDPVTDSWFLGVLATGRGVGSITRDLMETVKEVKIEGEWNQYLTGQRAQEFEMTIRNAVAALKWAMPHAVCPYCTGSGCQNCHEMGWVNKDTYDATARELQRLDK
jgi:hypothetical protein